MNESNLIIGLACMDLADSEAEAERKYQKVFKPFFRELYKYQEIKAVLHFSGVLLEWFEEKHPEVIMLLEELIKKRKQVEILGGGYYEPVLPMLSTQDRSGQLEALTTSLRKKFGRRPRGCWITGSIWDNSLVVSVRNSGMDYIFLDYSLMNNSCCKGTFNAPFITEDSGKLITVFPVHNFESFSGNNDIGEYLDTLKKHGSENGQVVSMFFTEHDLENKSEEWIELFFSSLQNERSIRVMNPGYYLRNAPKLNKQYFQNTNYYKTVFSENPAVNLVYARMMHAQTLIGQIRGDRYRKKSAVEALWAGQNYISFIGNHITQNSYEGRKKSRIKTYGSLIEAETLARQKGVFIPSLLRDDFDMDGFDEFLYQGEEFNTYIHLQGASVFELDCLKEKWNYCDALYCGNGNNSLMKSFCDYLADADCSAATVDDFIKSDTAGIHQKEFTLISFEREKKAVSFSIKVKNQEKGYSIKIVKEYRFFKKKFEVLYSLTNTGPSEFSGSLGTAINLCFLDKSGQGRHSCSPEGKALRIEDSCLNMIMSSDSNAEYYFNDVLFEGCYCYTSILPVCRIDSIEPGKSWDNRFEIKF